MATFTQNTWMQRFFKTIETLSCCYSLDSSREFHLYLLLFRAVVLQCNVIFTGFIRDRESQIQYQK